MHTHILTRALVSVCVHRHAGFLHVLFTPVILLHTAMETEFSIQISVLSGGMWMSVSDLKLFRGAFFSLGMALEALFRGSANTTFANPLY